MHITPSPFLGAIAELAVVHEALQTPLEEFGAGIPLLDLMVPADAPSSVGASRPPPWDVALNRAGVSLADLLEGKRFPPEPGPMSRDSLVDGSGGLADRDETVALAREVLEPALFGLTELDRMGDLDREVARAYLDRAAAVDLCEPLGLEPVLYCYELAKEAGAAAAPLSGEAVRTALKAKVAAEIEAARVTPFLRLDLFDFARWVIVGRLDLVKAEACRSAKVGNHIANLLRSQAPPNNLNLSATMPSAVILSSTRRWLVDAIVRALAKGNEYEARAARGSPCATIECLPAYSWNLKPRPLPRLQCIELGSEQLYHLRVYRKDGPDGPHRELIAAAKPAGRKSQSEKQKLRNKLELFIVQETNQQPPRVATKAEILALAVESLGASVTPHMFNKVVWPATARKGLIPATFTDPGRRT